MIEALQDNPEEWGRNALDHIPREAHSDKPLAFFVTENQIKSVLKHFSNRFKETKYIMDEAVLEDRATKMAKEIKENKDHKLREQIDALVSFLSANKLF